MTEKSIKVKAKKHLTKIQGLLKKALQGKDTGELGSELFIDDAVELIKFYKKVSTGKFKQASSFQAYDLDTATRDLIDLDIYNFLEEKYLVEE